MEAMQAQLQKSCEINRLVMQMGGAVFSNHCRDGDGDQVSICIGGDKWREQSIDTRRERAWHGDYTMALGLSQGFQSMSRCEPLWVCLNIGESHTYSWVHTPGFWCNSSVECFTYLSGDWVTTMHLLEIDGMETYDAVTLVWVDHSLPSGSTTTITSPQFSLCGNNGLKTHGERFSVSNSFSSLYGSQGGIWWGLHQIWVQNSREITVSHAMTEWLEPHGNYTLLI